MSISSSKLQLQPTEEKGQPSLPSHIPQLYKCSRTAWSIAAKTSAVPRMVSRSAELEYAVFPACLWRHERRVAPKQSFLIIAQPSPEA
jgi:hypothetical protein